MTYDVLAMPVQGIDFAPTSEAAEILQNIRTIITTTKYSVPLDRDFGINADMLDLPINVAQARAADCKKLVDKLQSDNQRAKQIIDELIRGAQTGAAQDAAH